MRAKRVKEIIRKAYCFDFDDTLVKTEGKVYIYKNGRMIKTLTPEEFNNYKLKPEEEMDLSDFKDPRLILSAKKFKMWPALQNIDTAIKQGRSSSDIFILTARSPITKMPIHTFFKRNGIDIPEDHIITIGDDMGIIDIAEEKKKVLRQLAMEYDEITFFDDNPNNIKLAQEIGNIRTRLIDSVNI